MHHNNDVIWRVHHHRLTRNANQVSGLGVLGWQVSSEMSNWGKYAGFPFGDRITTKEDNGEIKKGHDFKFKTGFTKNQVSHKSWKFQLFSHFYLHVSR